jgi:hypothetical protein
MTFSGSQECFKRQFLQKVKINLRETTTELQTLSRSLAGWVSSPG